jgi:hypothetical protein
MYKLFQMEFQGNPEILPALENEKDPAEAAPAAKPGDEVILEQDGIYIINSRALNPDAETKKNLDPKFLNLVESIIDPSKSGAS